MVHQECTSVQLNIISEGTVKEEHFVGVYLIVVDPSKNGVRQDSEKVADGWIMDVGSIEVLPTVSGLTRNFRPKTKRDSRPIDLLR